MITQEDRLKYASYSDDSILGHKLISGLFDVTIESLLGEIREISQEEAFPTGPMFQALVTLFRGGGKRDTNPAWIVARILDEAQDRGLLSNQEYDFLSQ